MTANRLTPVTRKLRQASTQAEACLWSHLRARRLDGEKFVRQQPIGPYVVDFACRSARLVVEVDGGQHAGSPTDPARTREIEAAGYTVLRFWNNEVMENTEGVLLAIADVLRIARNR